MRNNKTSMMVKIAMFSAIIVAMTVVPYTGYIAAGPIEITTLHIPVIIAACFLGAKAGAIVGGVWGVTCVLRAFTNPLWILFTNPLISVLPRIIVGLVAGLVFAALKKTKLGAVGAGIAAAVAGTLTNTALVLSAIHVFGDMLSSFGEAYKIFEAIWTTLISVNGVVELAAAVIVVPAVAASLMKAQGKKAE